MSKSINNFVVAGVLMASAVTSHASTLTFADLSGDEITPLANGYGGFNWNNANKVFSISKHGPGHINGIGYDIGAVSSDNMIYNGWGYTPVIITKANGSAFNFKSMTLTSAWFDQSVTLSGLLNGSVVNSATFNITPTLPLFISENWSNIDSLKIDSTKYQWAMGNFTYTTPIPAAVWLFASALMGLGAFRKKTKA